MHRTLLATLILAAAGCTSAGNSGPPCKLTAGDDCSCRAAITDPNTDSCHADLLGSAATCCRSESYPAATGDCYCAPVTCAAKGDSLAFCSCGIGQTTGTAVQSCSGVCCLNTVSGFCYCSNGSAGGCFAGDTSTTSCSVTSMAAGGACGMIYTQTTTCDVP